MKKILISGALIFFGALQTLAQNQVDALRYSQRFLQGDARTIGIGGAIGAVGANFSSSSVNPAGLGLFRRSEFKFSLGFYDINMKGTYLGYTTEDNKFNINIPDFSIVFAKVKTNRGKPVTEGWSNWAFGMGLNRLNNFNSRREYSGINDDNSILDYYVEDANGAFPSELNEFSYGFMAYETYLINDFYNPGNKYYRSFDTSRYDNLNLQQTVSISESGSTNEFNFSFGGNYSNILYIGATIGIPIINYYQTREFYEESLDYDSNYLSSLSTSTIDVRGIGYDATFGIIVRPHKYLRLGGSIKSPSFINFDDERTYSLGSYLNRNPETLENGRTEYYDEYEGNFEFDYVSPFRLTASIAVLAGKHGFISFDYEWLDYSRGYYSSDDYSFNSENNDLKRFYDIGHNLRIGGELRYNIFAFRAGYGIYGSPYDPDYEPSNADASRRVLSFGLGMREKGYFIDIAYQRCNWSEFDLPYSLKDTGVEGAEQELTASNFVLSFGLRF